MRKACLPAVTGPRNDKFHHPIFHDSAPDFTIQPFSCLLPAGQTTRKNLLLAGHGLKNASEASWQSAFPLRTGGYWYAVHRIARFWFPIHRSLQIGISSSHREADGQPCYPCWVYWLFKAPTSSLRLAYFFSDNIFQWSYCSFLKSLRSAEQFMLVPVAERIWVR